MTKRSAKKAIAALVVSGFVGSAMGALGLITFMLISNSYIMPESTSTHLKTKQFQHLRISSNFEVDVEPLVGTVSIYEELLLVDQYLTFKDEKGGTNLISDFDLTEYLCTGSCLCSTVEEEGTYSRKASSTPVIRTTSVLRTLVASVSTVFAIGLAQDMFKEECSDICSEEFEEYDSMKIVSEVDRILNCDPYYSRSHIEGEEGLDHLDEESEMAAHKNQRFLCSGECVNTWYQSSYNQNYDNKMVKKARNDLGIICEDLKMTDEVLAPDYVVAKERFLVGLEAYCRKSTEVDPVKSRIWEGDTPPPFPTARLCMNLHVVGCRPL